MELSEHILCAQKFLRLVGVFRHLRHASLGFQLNLVRNAMTLTRFRHFVNKNRRNQLIVMCLDEIIFQA